MWRMILCALLPTLPVEAETLVATRVLRAHSVLTAQDVALIPGRVSGALTHPTEALGQEIKVTLYAGRPISAADLQPPALVERNQLIRLVYNHEGLTIMAEGRALDRGAEDSPIRAINLTSKATVTGRVGPNGDLLISGEGS